MNKDKLNKTNRIFNNLAIIVPTTINHVKNKKICYYNSLPQYQIPASQQSAYRYYPVGSIFSSNHFSQSPNTYNTTSGSAAYK